MAISTQAVPVRRAEWLRNWAALVAILAVFAATGLACEHLGVLEAKAYFGEDGAIEIATPIVFVLAAILCVAWRQRTGVRSLVPSLILLLMAWRELDGDRWFTAQSVISSGYYFENPGVSYGQRIAVGAVVLALGLIILRFLWKARYRILTAITEFQPYGRSVIAAFTMLAASLVLDGLGRKVYALFGVHLTDTASALAGIVEETAELGMAVAFLVALLQLRFDTSENTLPGAFQAA